MANDTPPPEYRDPVDHHWGLTQQNVRDIGDIKSEVSGLASKVDSGFSGITTAIHQMSQPKPPGQWLGVSALVVSITLALGLVVSFTMGTLKSGTDSKFDSIKSTIGVLASHMETTVDQEIETGRLLAYRIAKLESLEVKVTHLDEENHINMRRILDRLTKLESGAAGTSALLEESNLRFTHGIERLSP